MDSKDIRLLRQDCNTRRSREAKWNGDAGQWIAIGMLFGVSPHVQRAGCIRIERGRRHRDLERHNISDAARFSNPHRTARTSGMKASSDQN
jgi:hypothetical protein